MATEQANQNGKNGHESSQKRSLGPSQTWPSSMENNQAEAQSAPPKPPRDMSQLSWICLVISLLTSMFLFALDNTVVADAQPKIIETFGHVDLLPWVSVAYALGSIALNLFLSNLFAKFDNKVLFITGVILFDVGSAICGAAPSMTALIIGRVINGLGGVGIFVGGMNLLSVMTSETERPFYLSIVGLSWGFGTVLGPIIGGAFTASSATWRWCFYLNLCVGGAVAPLYIFVLPSHNPRPGVSVGSRLRELDWMGAVLNAGAIASLIMGISFGGGYYAWSSGQIIGLFVCSGTLWILFAGQQALALFTTRENRIFPANYLRSLEMTILFVQVASSVAVVYIPLYFIPLFFQFVQNQSAFHAGIRLLPLVFFQVFGTILSGALMNSVGYYVVFYLAGGILSLVGGALLHTVKVDTSTSTIYGYSVLVGLGCGLYVQTGYAIAQLKVDPAAIPRVVAFIGFGQIAGITCALTISNSIFLNEATDKIAKILPSVPREVVQQAVTGTDGTFFENLTPADRAPILEALVQSIDNVYFMVIASGALSVILSLFMKREKLKTSPTKVEKTGNEGVAEKANDGS